MSLNSHIVAIKLRELKQTSRRRFVLTECFYFCYWVHFL